MLYLDATGAQNVRPGLEREELMENGTRSQRLYLELGGREPLMVFNRNDRVSFACNISDSGCSEENGLETEVLVMMRLL